MRTPGTGTGADLAIRLAAFEFLTRQTDIHGEVLPWRILAEGFLFGDQKIRLVGQQGIFKPAGMELPLSIRTTPFVEGRPRPYDDEFGSDGLIAYRYRGTDPSHRDNERLREAMIRGLPLIYNYGIVKGTYLPVWPVYIVGDDPAQLTFSVAVDDASVSATRVAEAAAVGAGEARREYITSTTRRRLHQASFRERVLRAYRETCSICRLHHAELLDAAHILPDRHPRGEPVVSNGLALCKLHHAAFDRHILGIRPDCTVEVRVDILREEDGPMLEHGLQRFQNQRILVPRKQGLQPAVDFLEERYELFRAA